VLFLQIHSVFLYNLDHLYGLYHLFHSFFKQTYELSAVVLHKGSSATSGHYYTLRKTHDGWFKYNDATISKVTDDELCQYLEGHLEEDTPYLLMYRAVPPSAAHEKYVVFVRTLILSI